jgi:PAS domain S-box-containing protein
MNINICQVKQVPLHKQNSPQPLHNLSDVSPWQALAHAGLGILVLDLNAQCIYWSLVLEKLTGISASEAMASSANELLACFSAELSDISPLALFGEITTFPDIQKADVFKTQHWLSASLSPLRDETGSINGLLCLVSDVTKRKENELASAQLMPLQMQEFEYQKDFYDNAPIGFHCLDPNGFFLEINETELNWLGYTREEMIGKMQIDNILAPTYKGHYKNNLPHIIRNKGAKDVVLELQRKNGTTFFVQLNSSIRSDENGNLLSTRASLSDITDKKKAEEDLRSKEELFRNLIESSSDIILILNSDLLIEYASPSLERVLGYKPDQILGVSGLEHLHPSDTAEVMTALESARNKPGEVYSAKYRHQHRDGSWKHMEASGTVLVTGIARQPLFIINVRDISDHARTEELLQDKVNELNTFMYKATHDLRAPLSSLLGLIALAKAEKNKQEMLKYFTMIDDSTHKLDKILIDLVEITQITQGIPQISEIKLEELIGDVIESLENTPGFKGISISRKLSLGKPFYSDPKLMRSVLQNLLDNSAKYKSPEKKNEITIEAVETSTGVKVLISDNGIGIPDNYHAKVFHMFYRATNISSGTGLGLYIVKNSIEKLGGLIELESVEGQGTTISFSLPSSCTLK